MSEITLYEAQAKKMQGICDEHNLTYRFLKDRYPIIFIIRRLYQPRSRNDVDLQRRCA